MPGHYRPPEQVSGQVRYGVMLAHVLHLCPAQSHAYETNCFGTDTAHPRAIAAAITVRRRASRDTHPSVLRPPRDAVQRLSQARGSLAYELAPEQMPESRATGSPPSTLPCYAQHLRATRVRGRRDVADRTLVLKHVGDDLCLVLEAGGRNIASGKNLLLPVRSDGIDRTI